MPNLRHLCEPLGGTEGMIETVGFKKTTESKAYVVMNKRECQQGVSYKPREQQRWNHGKQTCLATVLRRPWQPETDRRIDRQTDAIMMPITDHTL